MDYQITIFQNIRDTSTPFFRDVSVVLQRVKDGNSKDLINQIRKEKDKEKRNILKKGLPAVCFSGQFNKREDSSIIEHSGLICLDFDGYTTIKSLQEERKKLQKDPFTFALFTSPSGNGLKVLVKIPKEVDNHKTYFNALEKHYNSEHFDKACKNISRVCYESYDPKIYVNVKSKLWDTQDDKGYDQLKVSDGFKTIRVSNQDEIVKRLKSWWEKKYGMIDGERNNNVYILASAFNDFGINKDLASYVLGSYSQEDFGDNEIKITLESAYRNIQNFNTKYFEDRDRVNSVRDKLRAGVQKKKIRSQLVEAGIEGDVADAVIEAKEKESNSLRFWNKSDKGVVTVIHFMFRAFLQDRGYYRYYPDGGKSFIFIKIESNRVYNTNEEKIKDDVLGYLQNLEDLSIYNHFADKTRYFKEDFLSMLDFKEIPFLNDSSKVSYIYYKNCAVKVTPNDIEKVEYENLGGYVWNDQIINRDFDFCESNECDYKTFIANISNNNPDRIRSMHSTIGFLLQGYKDKGFCPAVIINDEVISDNPEGGTGKGLFVQGITEMKKNVVINGKEFSFDKSFAYQLVSADTQILTFDDVKKNFIFENLFSVITEGITLEKKNKDAIKIPYEQSPKVIITTNYAIKGKGNSFDRRKWELELTRYYNTDMTPFDEFGRLLFDDWDDGEWCRFDNYMLNNLKFFLKNGFVKSEFKNLEVRRFIAETNHQFYEWVSDRDNNLLDRTLYKADAYNQFVADNPDYYKKLTRIQFGKWLVAYANFVMGKNPEEGRDKHGRYIYIESPKDKQVTMII
tara:strand:+ start:837 stop:3218 length:2382 start_codon:yes stop_codon:yes gene_type:complete